MARRTKLDEENAANLRAYQQIAQEIRVYLIILADHNSVARPRIDMEALAGPLDGLNVLHHIRSEIALCIKGKQPFGE